MRTPEAAVKYAGECCLRIAAVGRCMVPAVLPYESEVAHDAAPITYHHQQCRKAGGDIVCDVVDVCRPASEVLVSLRLVAYHRVEGVHHLICQHAGSAEQGEPEERGYHTVAQVLCERLKGCSAHFLGRESRRVAAYDAGHLCPSFLQRPVESREHRPHLANQGRSRKAIEHHHRIKEVEQQRYLIYRLVSAVEEQQGEDA